ncbi:MAG: tetratricopeptide repeat protein [Sphingomonas sp.]
MTTTRTRLHFRFWALPIYVIAAGLIVAGLSSMWGQATTRQATPLPLNTLRLSYGPSSYSAAMALANSAVALGEERVARRGQDWINQESYARALIGRARLNLSFDDLAAADSALAKGKAQAIAGSGPMLTAAVHNFTLHRLAPIEADLAVVDNAAVPADPGDRAEVIALRGDIAFYRGNYAKAISYYKESARVWFSPGTLFRIALWEKKGGHFDAALASFAKAATINAERTPQFMANIYLQIGTVELERGNWPVAEQWFQKADRAFPGNWLIQAHVVQMWALRGDLAQAARGYQQIIRRSPQPDVMDALAALYRVQGNAVASRQWADRAGSIWSARVRQLPEAAYAHALEHELVLGDAAQALALARKNMAARPFGDSATLLSWALLANNRPGEARDVLEALNQTHWQTAQQYVALSQAYAMLGDSSRSDAAREAALKINLRAVDPAAPLIWFGHH